MTTGTGWRRCRDVCLSLWLAGVGAAVGCDAPGPAGARDDDAPAAEQLAGEVCITSKECATEEYCQTEEGACGREGVCTPLPASCERIREPVCSCDGLTYENGCFAAKDKQNVDYGGPCPPPPCTSNAECDATAYCARSTGDCQGTGTCEPRPPLCSGAWKPVCGCNNVTYANACKAAAVGVTIKKLGTC